MGVSPYFRFDRQVLRKMIDGAMRRSSLSSYQRYAGTLSAHLQWILEIPENGDDVSGGIESALGSLVSSIRLLADWTPVNGKNALAAHVTHGRPVRQ